MILGIKEKSKILIHTMYFLAIAKNMNGFVVQGHIYHDNVFFIYF